MSMNKNDGQFEKNALGPVDTADDNEEIIDLLQVVKPGKNAETQARSGQDVDFSANREAVLSSLSEAEKQAAGEEGHSAAPVAPSPEAHVGEHAENPDLPGMDDIDKLLEDLAEDVEDPNQGDDPLSAVVTEAAAYVPPDRIEVQDTLPVAHEEDPPAAVSAAKVEIDDDFLHALPQNPEKTVPLKSRVDKTLLREGKSPTADAGEEKSAPPHEEDALDIVDFGEAADIDDALLLDAELPGQDESVHPPEDRKEKNAAVPNKDPSPRGQVDLNELDALVDDVLAASPAQSPAVPLAAAITPTLFDGELAKLRSELGKVAGDLRESFTSTRNSLEKDSFAALAKATSAESGVESLKTYLHEQSSAITRQNDMIDESAKLVQEHAQGIEEIRAELLKNGQAVSKLEETLSAGTLRVDGTEKSLAKQAARLQGLEKTLSGQSAGIQKLEQSLADQSTSIQELGQKSDGFSASIQKLEQTSDGYSVTIQKLGQTTDRHSASIRELRQALDGHATRMRDLEESISGQPGELQDQGQNLAGQSADVEELKQSIAGQSTLLQNMEQSIAGQGASLKELGQKLAGQVKILAGHKQSLTALEEGLTSLSSLSDRLDGTEQSMAEQVNRLKKSENGLAAFEKKANETEKLVADYAKSVQQGLQNLTGLTDRIASLEERFTALESKIEKTAAAAAAKVIREEITALLKG